MNRLLGILLNRLENSGVVFLRLSKRPRKHEYGKADYEDNYKTGSKPPKCFIK